MAEPVYSILILNHPSSEGVGLSWWESGVVSSCGEPSSPLYTSNLVFILNWSACLCACVCAYLLDVTYSLMALLSTREPHFSSRPCPIVPL